MNGTPENPNPEEEPKPVLLRVRQVAKLLQRCPARIYQMVAYREIGFIRDGRSIRIPADEVAAWIRRKRRESGC